jgi:hypothetical protein
MDNQALAFDAHPPDHPVAKRAAKRIEALDVRAERIKDEIAMLEEQRPMGATPEEVEALLAAVPDLRPALEAATHEELAAIFETFDLTARYNHLTKTLELNVVLAPELLETKRPPGGGRRKSGIAGARYEGVPTTAFRIEELRRLQSLRRLIA